jgi:hypothetical protein
MKWRMILVFVFILIASGCTFYNKQSFQIEQSNSKSPEVVMKEIESYFVEIGFKLEKRRHITYPKDEMYSQFFLGKHTKPLLYTAFDHVILRLNNGEQLFIDWVRISDKKEVPPPGYFDPFYKKVADTIESRTGVKVSFKLITDKPVSVDRTN